MEQWGRTCGVPQDDPEMGGFAFGGEGLSLEEALEVLGFADVASFSAWSAEAQSHEVYDVAVELLYLMSEPLE